MKIYSALFNEFYPFDLMFDEVELVKVTQPAELSDDGKPSILVIWGGEDIHPDWYGRPNIASHVTVFPSRRDVLEANLFKQAVALGIPIIGVCRGAQLGCALSGGILIQDVTGHVTDHQITDKWGDTYFTSSLHHQVMYPWNIDPQLYELIAWTNIPRSRYYKGISNEEAASALNIGRLEPEAVWFSESRCLAIQGHPEYEESESQLNVHVKKYIEHYVR